MAGDRSSVDGFVVGYTAQSKRQLTSYQFVIADLVNKMTDAHTSTSPRFPLLGLTAMACGLTRSL